MPAEIKLPHVVDGRPGSGGTVYTWGVIAGACLITLVGAIDDARDLRPQWKLLGQIIAAVIAVDAGAVVKDITLPFVGGLQFPNTGGLLTVIWLVALMNVVNFSDGVDGLAAGVAGLPAWAAADRRRVLRASARCMRSVPGSGARSRRSSSRTTRSTALPPPCGRAT